MNDVFVKNDNLGFTLYIYTTDGPKDVTIINASSKEPKDKKLKKKIVAIKNNVLKPVAINVRACKLNNLDNLSYSIQTIEKDKDGDTIFIISALNGN